MKKTIDASLLARRSVASVAEAACRLLVPLAMLLLLLMACAPKAKPLVLELAPGVEMELVNVPAGEFLMGSTEGDEMADFDEAPQHTLNLDAYYIGKYEVTVAQYRAFVEATGHKFAEKALAGESDHPARYANWDDAVAFCEWASEATGRDIRLPTEAEWEKAARGTDGRRYPWGDEAPDESRCNFDGNVGDTSPVGSYSPAGDSPFGCADMAGNVKEFTGSAYKPYPYDPDDGRDDPSLVGTTEATVAVTRGGDWFLDAGRVRSARRMGGTWASYTGQREESAGFRVATSGE